VNLFYDSKKVIGRKTINEITVLSFYRSNPNELISFNNNLATDQSLVKNSFTYN
jgi:hypothetical protein